jgi:hypothetical protein
VYVKGSRLIDWRPRFLFVLSEYWRAYNDYFIGFADILYQFCNFGSVIVVQLSSIVEVGNQTSVSSETEMYL